MMKSELKIKSGLLNSKKVIVHIAPDEKFINSAYWQFESIDGIENKFYIIVENLQEDLKHVEMKEGMFLVQNKFSVLKKLAKSIANSDLVCFHSLGVPTSIVLNRLPKDIKTIWMLFGSEIYNNDEFFDMKEILGRQTYKTYLSNSQPKGLIRSLKNTFRTSYYRIIKGTLTPAKELSRAMKSAHYCGILYKEDFEVVKQKIGTNIEHLKFTYYPIEKMLPDSDVFISGQNILLGNSASYTNNHFEALEILSHFNLEDRKIISPLSYGDRNNKLLIEEEGKSIFKDNFEALINFMPLHEYNSYIQSCSIVIMNNYRQQAVGNVLTMLWMGAKVYLDKRNSLYHYLKRINVVVYEISESLHSNNAQALKPLTRDQQLNNRNCLRNEISERTLLKELKQSLNSII